MFRPPSTGKETPLIILDLSLRRNKMASTLSSISENLYLSNIILNPLTCKVY